MNALQHALFRRTAWLQLVAMSLAAFLQRMPLLKVLVSGEFSPGRLSPSYVLHSSLVIAASVGAMDTLVGATVVSGTPASPASATVGTAFSAAFSTTGAPAAAKSYTVNNLPPGLAVPSGTLSGTKYTINASTVSITGTPTTAGSWIVTVTAWEKADAAGGSKSLSYTINVASNGTAPSITSQPASLTVTAGASASFSVTASGTAPLTYQWTKGGATINGATSSTYSIASTVTGDAGNYAVTVTNSAGTATSNVATLTVSAAAVSAPVVTSSPASVTQAAGSSLSLSATVTGGGLSYQWSKDGVAITGATASTYTVPSLTAANAGDYTVTAVNSLGTATSRFARVTVATPVPGRIMNLSVRSVAGVGGNPLIVGFVMDGGSKSVLLRAVGPTLGLFGVSGTLADPILVLHESVSGVDTIRATNDNWGDNGGSATLPAVFNAAGAFGLATGSKDAAMVADVSGARTAHINSVTAGVSGVVLLEAYDTVSGVSPRFMNVSVRNYAGSGSESLIAGFVIDGNQPKRLLIRGIGPGLGLFGITGFLADPRLDLYESVNGNNVLRASNDNWGDETGAAAAASSAGAFGLTAGSQDASIVITLPPGAYSAIASGNAGGTGEAMVEVYELP